MQSNYHPDQAGCSICKQLSDREFASQKFGWEENDTSLPAAAGQLVKILDLQPGSQREKQIWQCPECSTYYFYESNYEYLVNGSEDEQTLTRIPGEVAREILTSASDGQQ